MISTSGLSVKFGGRTLFDDVNVKFTPGNCYGLIGANGAGKSTFLKVLSGDQESTEGQVIMDSGLRLSFLKQDQSAYDEETVINTILMGNTKLYAVMTEKDALYAKPDFNEEDGIRASDLEAEFAEMNGYEAESDAGVLLAGLGIPVEFNEKLMKELDSSLKVKILLAQALFGKPEVLLLDEPTNHLDIQAIKWQSSQLSQQLKADQNKKSAAKAEELKKFIARFSANASKSKQATSRQKQLEKLEVADMPVSSRKYPFVGFTSKREAGNDILNVTGLSKSVDGEDLLKNISFQVKKGDKIAILGKNDVAKTALFEILAGELEPDSGKVEWGVTVTKSYFPSDNTKYFQTDDDNLVDWLRNYSDDKDETFVRGFLGKMLFSRDEAFKSPKVLSGGERVRCMLSKMMLSGANVLMLDHPTAHLDLESVTAVNDGIRRFEGTVIFTSEDHEFVQTIADRIIDIDVELKEDKYITYDEYIQSTLS